MITTALIITSATLGSFVVIMLILTASSRKKKGERMKIEDITVKDFFKDIDNVFTWPDFPAIFVRRQFDDLGANLSNRVEVWGVLTQRHPPITQRYFSYMGIPLVIFWRENTSDSVECIMSLSRFRQKYRDYRLVSGGKSDELGR